MTSFAEIEAQRREALAALRDLFAMMDEGLLVRDISKDGEPAFAMRNLSFVQRLQKAHAALDRADAVSIQPSI